MTDNREIKTLDYVSHMLLRSGMYIGSTTPTEKFAWIIDENNKVVYKKITYTDGLLKIVNEVLDNSIDEGIKTNWNFSNKIDIEFTEDTCTIKDNGRGIPVKKNSEGEWMPVAALCKGMTGSNFEDNDRQSIGQNGTGSKCTNAFSKKFECITCDGNGKLKIICKDNLSSTKVSELAPTTQTGTKITFTPDFNRFGVKEFKPELITMIKTRLKFLSWFFPKCNFTLNKEKLNIKTKDLQSLFSSNSVVLNSQNVYICLYPSDEPYFLTYLNGLYLKNGGTHVDYILNKIIGDIREKTSKKYKSIKPADIKNRLGIVVFFNNFPNCSFDSQTKETLTNSATDILNYLKDNEIDLDKFSSKVIKSKEIIDNITDLFKLKEELAEKKELAKINKSKKELDSEKYYPPIGKTTKKYLMITEGFSAFSGISAILGRKSIGYYMLKGKLLNILDLKPRTFLENKEIRDLINILGIELGNKNTNINYEKVVILTDADADGSAIAGLVLTMFSVLAPKMIEEGRICRLETPLLIGSKNGKIEEYYFKFPDKSKMKKGLDWFYLKGLGSWNKDKFNQILEKEGGMEKLIHPYSMDKEAFNSINNWFGKDSDFRKEALRGKEFHIDNA